jgi:DNA repair exonuclease SbcCD ATPase subunit
MNYVYGINKDLNVKNGSGKSTIFVDAILFALFNKTSKGVSKPKIPHRLSDKDCQVTMNFDIGGENYTIENNINYTFAKLTRHHDDKEDEDLTKSSIKETYEYLEREILNSTFIMFRNALVLSINDNKNIFKMTKWDKRQFQEQMMGLAHVGKMFQTAKDELNSLDKELTSKRQHVNKLEKDIEEFKKKSKSFEIDKKENIQEIKNEIQTLSDKMSNMDTDDSDLVDRRERAKEDLEEKETKFKQVEEVCDTLHGTVVSLRENLTMFEQTQAKYAKVLDILCTDCTTEADKVLGIESIKNNLDSTVEKLRKLTEKQETLTNVYTALENEIAKLEVDIRRYDTRISQIAKNRQELVHLGDRITEKEESIKKEEVKVSPFLDLIEKYEADLLATNQVIEKMMDDRKYLDFLVHMTSEDGIRKHLLLDYVNILNNRIRKYLEEMGCEYTALFDGNLNCEFLTTTGPCEYDNFSAGEKVRIDSACMFAFRDILFGQGTLQSNIFVCDEILDASLDEYAIQSVVNILKDIAKTQTVFVISHRECVSPEEFNNIIAVKKQHGYTTIVGEEEEIEI